jgi:hypothetical protein
MRQAGIVVLSASYDPGWTATVDGRSQPTEMVAPALVATTVPAGTHRIIFRYRGWQDYPLLFAISAAMLLTLLCAEVARPHDGAPPAGPAPRRNAKHRRSRQGGAARLLQPGVLSLLAGRGRDDG